MKKHIETFTERLLKENSEFGPGSKHNEYVRTIELFEQIYKEKGLYFAIALLYDSQYDNKDLLGMMEVLKPGKGKISDILKATQSIKESKKEYPDLRVVEVTYENGDKITTSMAANLTDKQIKDYFKVGKEFNIGSVKDLLSKVKSVKILK